MRSLGDYPALGSVKSALWMEERGSNPERGQGSGQVLLTTADVSCDDFLSSRFVEDELFYDESGILAEFSWDYDTFDRGDPIDAGWEGVYYQGMEVETKVDGGTVERWLEVVVFTEGSAWASYYMDGVGEITSAEGELVKGHLKTDAVQARFQAENCGQDQRDQGDSGDGN